MGLFSSVGGILNDITGATSAGSQSQKYAIQSANLNHKYQKEFAQNAHQWEVEDLKKAGLNPILSAGGGGASASGGGVGAATQAGSGYTPIDLFNGITSASRTMAESENIDAQTLLTKMQTQIAGIDAMIKGKSSNATIQKAKADLVQTLEQTKLIQGGKAAQIVGTNPKKTIQNTIGAGNRPSYTKKDKKEKRKGAGARADLLGNLERILK